MAEHGPERPKNAEEQETALASKKPRGAKEPLPEQIGPYKILEVIGEGGMGVVYHAEQVEPVRRRVALKVIKLGMDTKQFVARFESERQALALMNSPNIAQVFEAGATEQGRPYFVMELVRGDPITEYCDRHRLDTRQRLELFMQVCGGVQHAHQKGVIHRDLKPSNILVTLQDQKAVPKIIDFGVAKATAQPLTEQTLFTEVGQVIGTPEYMSPEQAEMRGQDIDTRTDVYSLGILLYELLVGALPFDARALRRAGLDEFRRRIREEDPPRPSIRMTTLGDDSNRVARNRHTDPAALMRQLRGDLDWIVMRAVEKDPTRRYASASEFASDIARHLRHEPVLASPPSTVYRIGKFVRRHKTGVAAGVFVLAALLAGIAGTTIGLVRATKAEASAKQEAETAKQVSGFLVRLFEVSDPRQARGNTITAREILDRGAEKINQQMEGQPLVQARLMTTMGGVYRRLGLYEQARQLLEKALATRRAALGDDHLGVANSLNNLGLLLWSTGDYHQAQPLIERALEIQETSLGPDHPDVASTLNSLGLLHKETGDYDGARPLFERVLEIRTKALGPDHPDVATGLNNLATISLETGDFEGARPLFKRALEIQEKSLGPDHPDVPRTLDNLATLFYWTGDYAEAKQLRERALPLYEKALGPDHPDVASGLNNLATVLLETGDFAEAKQLLERALAIDEKTLGPDHPTYAIHLHSLGELMLRTRNLAEAERYLQSALEIYEHEFRSDHPYIALIFYNLACLSALQNDRETAIDFLRQSLERGYADDTIVDNPDLSSLHGNPEFEAIVAEVERRIAESD